MPASERAADRGSRTAAQAVVRVGAEIRLARTGAGLSLHAVATASRVSVSELSRIERGQSPRVPAVVLGRVAAIVGLDLSIKTYPGGDPIRDAGQHRLIAAFASALHPALRWAVEVPLPASHDPRAWDGLLAGDGWRYGVEAETQPRDAQALLRRLGLKARDGGVDGLILVIPTTRRGRAFVRGASIELGAMFPVPGRAAMRRLHRAEDPGGSSFVILPTDLPHATHLPPATDLPPASHLPPATDLPPASHLPPATDLPPATHLPPATDLPPGGTDDTSRAS